MQDRNAWYLAEEISDTNIILIIKQLGNMYSFESTCVCQADHPVLPPPCINGANRFAGTQRASGTGGLLNFDRTTCECPCFTEPQHQPCANVYTGLVRHVTALYELHVQIMQVCVHATMLIVYNES